MNLKELGKRIRAQREKCRLKQVDIANALQISAQAVSKWERGENAPDIAVLLDLTRLLGISTDWLLGRSAVSQDTFPATVLCTSLNGYARRSAEMQPRDIAAWMNGVFQQLTEAVLRCDGVPVKYVGDGFLAFFSGNKHPDRAYEATRHAQMITRNPNLIVTLDCGEIYLGAIGHPDYSRPDIIGETVNTAFLVNGWASTHAPGGLALTEAAVRGLSKKPVLRKHEKLKIKGLSAPLTLYTPPGNRNKS